MKNELQKIFEELDLILKHSKPEFDLLYLKFKNDVKEYYSRNYFTSQLLKIFSKTKNINTAYEVNLILHHIKKLQNQKKTKKRNYTLGYYNKQQYM